jgi:hypothetical protein
MFRASVSAHCRCLQARTNNFAASLDHSLAFPHHGNNRTRAHVLYKVLEERPAGHDVHDDLLASVLWTVYHTYCGARLQNAAAGAASWLHMEQTRAATVPQNIVCILSSYHARFALSATTWDSMGAILGRQVLVVGLCMVLADVLHLHRTQVEALLLEALDDLSNQASLDAVWLDHDVRLLHGGRLTRSVPAERRTKRSLISASRTSVVCTWTFHRFEPALRLANSEERPRGLRIFQEFN